MEKEYSIRDIRLYQLEESARVIRASFQTVADEFGFTPENNPTHGAFIQSPQLERLFEKGIKMLGLYTEDRQAGFVAVEKRSPSLYYLEKLAVIPQHRHKGYGRALVEHAREYVRQSGGTQISIGIINEDVRLKKWYESCGFIETETKQFPHLSFTVCFMRLDV